MISKIFFGPAGIGGVDEAVDNLRRFSELGLRACEVAFTYGVYMKKSDAERIGKEAKRLGIRLSIHSPYFVNLNSKEKSKVEASKRRILKCCEIGHYLGAGCVVVHAGFYSGMDREKAFERIAEQVAEIKKVIGEKRWKVDVCVETMGKVNVFGSLEEVSRLVKETGCGFCIDFAHVLARYKEKKFGDIKRLFPQKEWHCHFSGIVYGEKGEKRHVETSERDWKELLEFLRGLGKKITIICESPFPVEDSVFGLKMYEKMNNKA